MKKFLIAMTAAALMPMTATAGGVVLGEEDLVALATNRGVCGTRAVISAVRDGDKIVVTCGAGAGGYGSLAGGAGIAAGALALVVIAVAAGSNSSTPDTQ